MGDDYMEDICANIKVHIGFAIPGIKFCSVNNVQMKNEVVFGVAAGRRALRGWTVVMMVLDDDVLCLVDVARVTNFFS
ncbi:hypothetical protein R6Q59_031521 [Mikania micrantha]